MWSYVPPLRDMHFVMDELLEVRGDYLYLAGLLIVGTVWTRTARLAAPRLRESFYASKLQSAQFFFDYLMPEARLRLDLLSKQHCALPWVGGD